MRRTTSRRVIVAQFRKLPDQLFEHACSLVPVAFADIPPFAVFGIDDQPSLLLGTDVMETFRRVQLDFRERRVRFQLRKCAQVVRISTTGNYASRLSTDNEATCRR